MIGNEAALAVIYSGEAITCQLENPDLEYVIPKEGSNMWIDSWVIPKNAKNKENAEAFINFMCRPDIAKMNFDYITYSIPNEEENSSIRNTVIIQLYFQMIKHWKIAKHSNSWEMKMMPYTMNYGVR